MGILSDVKKILGYSSDNVDFDLDIITHINTSLAFLHQLGVGPEDGLSIADDTTSWESLVTATQLNLVKTYVYLRVRRLLDPPTTSFLLQAYADQIEELEWRITVAVEESASPV